MPDDDSIGSYGGWLSLVIGIVMFTIMIFVTININEFIADSLTEEIIDNNKEQQEQKDNIISVITQNSIQGTIKGLSSTEENYIINFNGDNNDYVFTDVDSTEYNLLQYAFSNNENVQLIFSTDNNEVYSLDGVILSSPTIPSDETPTDTSFNYWILFMIVPPILYGAYLTGSYIVRQNNMRQIIDDIPEPSNIIMKIEGEKIEKKNKKQKEQQKQTINPFNEESRMERLDELLTEKKKDKKNRR